MVIIITVVNLSAVDLNLLWVLHAVLEERSATRAARRLHVTQSAVSNALGRLRELFDDPLLVRHARGLSPTPRARALQPRLLSVMRELGAIVAPEAAFDPKATAREFTIASADYFGTVLLPPLIALLRARAPEARLRAVSLEHLVASDGLAEDIDVHVGLPPRIAIGTTAVDLFEERFVCLTRPDGKRPSRRMGLREYVGAEHVRVQVLGSARDPIDVELARRGLARRVVATVPHFSLAPLIVLRTGCVATLARGLAETYAAFLPLAVREPPLALGARMVKLIWHRRTEADPGARFFRDLVIEAARSVRTASLAPAGPAAKARSGGAPRRGAREGRQ